MVGYVAHKTILMPNSLPPGQPTATKTVTQLTDNLGLFLFSHFAGYLLSPVFWFYPLSMAYVHGKYPSIKDFKALVFTNRFIKCSLVGWLLSLIPILGFASLPFYSHYVFTKDDEPFDLIRESMSESLEDPSFIIKSTIAAIVSCFGIFLCFVGQIITIPLACIFIYGEMLNITEKLITPLKKRLHKKTVKETIEETSNETSKEPSQSPFSNRKDRVDILMKTKDAINNDNLSQLRLLITRDGLDPNYTILPGEWTLLHKSIEDGKVEIAKLLIDSGANIYAKGGWSKRTPLGLIIQQNNSFLMEYLISKGNFNSEKGKWATGYCKWKIIKGHHEKLPFPRMGGPCQAT
ncbi:MAG: ankyrin repeat domain-containing protein, partial [Synechococcus sp. SB0675_bin_6]|nr:ankyrin repeat domain-containing protein [Synechococcus sp. SB0675_bin_6]